MLRSERFLVLTNQATNNLFGGPNLERSICQRWLEFFVEFDFAWIHNKDVDPRWNDLDRIQTLSTRMLNSTSKAFCHTPNY